MRDWLAEALDATPSGTPGMSGTMARPSVDEMDRSPESPTFGTSVHFVHGGPCKSAGVDATPIGEAPPPISPFLPGPAGDWQRALAALDPVSPPCPGFRHWPSVRSHALKFLDERGEEVIALGWGVLDLFGVHHKIGTIRGDCCGALLGLTGRPVVELTSHLLRFSDGLAYRRRPMLATITIPIWEFKR